MTRIHPKVHSNDKGPHGKNSVASRTSDSGTTTPACIDCKHANALAYICLPSEHLPCSQHCALHGVESLVPLAAGREHLDPSSSLWLSSGIGTSELHKWTGKARVARSTLYGVFRFEDLC